MSIISTLHWLITAAGAFFLIKLRGFFIFHPIKAFSSVFKGKKSDFTALALALAGTLGVGNVVGVSVGIATGGAGSVFWLILSSLFSSVIKYAEVSLSVDNARLGGNGFIGTIKKTFKKMGIPLSYIYTLLCLLLSFTMGSALQCSAITECAETAFGIDGRFMLIPIILTVCFVVLGGSEKIEKAVSIIIPLTTLVYIFMCFCVILSSFSRLPSIINLIFINAFSPESFRGGILGFLISKPITEGYARGILSNEAGAGTSSFAHVRSTDRTPHEAGIFGILEVVFDTVVLCSLTAFTILLGLPEESLSSGGGMLIAEAFGVYLGDIGGYLLFVSIFFFAVSTVFCWYYYGSVCWQGLFPKNSEKAYFPLFLLSAAAGVFYNGLAIMSLTDVLLFMLSLITLITLIKNSDKVKALSLQMK